MNFNWLKSMMPKGLYGRAALILILPVVTIQLVVSVVFIQRHFDGVTEQLTANVALEIRYLVDAINREADSQGADAVIDAIAEPLGFRVARLPRDAADRQDRYRFDDLTGKAVIRELRGHLPTVWRVDLASDVKRVNLVVSTDHGRYLINFNRLRVSASNPHQLLVLMIVVAIFMTIISLIFFRNQVRPIRRLARAADAFGKGRSAPYRVAGATEVRQAGQAFLDMRDRIERQIEQRTLMLSGVSHDLRTPLTRLKLGLSLAPDAASSGELMRDVDDMEAMLEEFLAFARGDSMEQTQQSDPFALVQQSARDARRLNGEVALVLPPAPRRPLMVAMRPNALRRALDNLVENALRYGSRCRLSLEIRPTELSFVVEDDGPGIPIHAREQAMRPFERLDSARNQNTSSGVGLGLAIAVDIALSHGGALELTDSREMGGLRAELRLPV